MATKTADQDEEVELLTPEEQAELDMQLIAELESVCDVFGGTVEWDFQQAECTTGGHSKFYRIYDRRDRTGAHAYVQWGPRPKDTSIRNYTTRGQKQQLAPYVAWDRWHKKTSRDYNQVESFVFRAPSDASYEDLARRAAAAIANPHLRVR